MLHTSPMRSSSLRLATVFVVGGLLLSGCGIAEARESALKIANTDPLASVNAWTPGLVGLPDYQSSGFGPNGYPGVDSGQGTESPLGDIQGFLDGLSLQSSDLQNVTVELIKNGDSLEGATLDFCGADYASEQLRTHRRQVAGTFNNGGSWISSEVVQYQTPAAAQQAIDELVAAKKSCPENNVFTDGTGEEMKINFYAAPGPNETVLVPAKQRVIMHFVETPTDTAQIARRLFLAVQVRGNTLVALYFVEGQPEPYDQSTLDAVYGVVSLLTERLNSADSTSVGLA